MRATYESDAPPPCHQSPVTKSPFAEVQLIPQTDILGGVRMVHPDDYEFNSPTDFGAYAVAKHPSLVSIFQPLHTLPIPPPPYLPPIAATDMLLLTAYFFHRLSTMCWIFSSCTTRRWLGMSRISGVPWWSGTPSSLTGLLITLVLRIYRWCTRSLKSANHFSVPTLSSLILFQMKVTSFVPNHPRRSFFRVLYQMWPTHAFIGHLKVRNPPRAPPLNNPQPCKYG